MENTENQAESSDLRQEAEVSRKNGTARSVSQLTESAIKLVHELQVQKIELELLNDELRLANKRAEDAAKTAEAATERYTELYDFSPSGYFTFSIEGKIIQLNLSGARMLGKERALLINNRFGFFVTFDTRPIFNLFLDKVYSSKTKESCDVILSSIDNSPMYVHIEGIVSEEGKQCFATVINITELNRTKDALREIDARYRADEAKNESAKIWQATFDGIRDSVLLLDANGLILEANKVSCNIFGKTKEEIIGSHCNEIVHKRDCRIDDCPCMRTRLSKCRETKLFEIEDKWFEVVVDPLFDKNNEINCFVHIMSDITDRKRAEEALYDSEKKYRLLSENSTDGVSLFEDHAVKYVSNGYLNMLGYDKSEIENISFEQIFSFIHEDDSKNIQSIIGEAHSHQTKSFRYDYRVRNKIGEYIWVEDTINAEFDALGSHKRSVIHSRNITERKRVEAELQQSNERLEAIISASPDGIGIINLEGEIGFISDTMLEMFGYPAEQKDDLIGKYIFEFIDPSNINLVIDSIRKLIAGEIGGSLRQYKVIKKDKTRFTVELNSAVLLDSNGVPARILFVQRDITERERAEAALRESEEIFNQLLKNSPIYIFFKDENIRAVRLSENFEQMLNIPIKDIIGKNMNELFPSELAKNMVEDDKKILQLGELVIVDEEFNGRYYTSTKFPINIEGKSRYLAGFTIDITDRKMIENALIESEEKYRSIVQYSSEPIFGFNPDGTYRLVNEAFAKTFGKTREEIIGKTPHFLFSSDEAEKRMAIVRKVLLTGEKDEIELKVITFSGEEKYFLTMLDPIKDSLGNVLWVSCISKDITERKQTEIIIQNQNNQLQELNATKDKFFSIIAHDLKSPFQGLLGISELLTNSEYKFSAEDIDKCHNSLHTSIVNVYILLENLLEWAQFQKGSIAFTPREISIFDAFLESEESIKQRAAQKGITIINKNPQDIKIYADEKMMNTILRNLLSNAVKFTNKTGKVVGKARETESGMIEISVTDTGVGIPADVVDKLFKLGENVGQKGTDDEPSTGLGLLLCKDFVEKNGGKIWVESEEGKGSTFYFTMPKTIVNG